VATGQSRRFGTATASRRARGSGYRAHARKRLETGSGTIRGLRPARKPCRGLAGLDRLLIIPTVDPVPGKRGAQNAAAIDAAVRAGVKHVVFVSAAGSRQEEEPALGAPYWRGEQRLIATALTGDVERLGGRPPKPLRDELVGALKSPSA
jgi:uncharacterized protein YbjT (DUF2867 family)